MKNILKNDITILVELLSAVSFFLMAITLGISETITINSKSPYFWSVVFFILSALQLLGIKLKFELSILRVCMAWIAGSLWCTLYLSALNNVLSIPILLIGLFNIYAFVVLSKKATFDWQKILNR